MRPGVSVSNVASMDRPALSRPGVTIMACGDRWTLPFLSSTGAILTASETDAGHDNRPRRFLRVSPQHPRPAGVSRRQRLPPYPVGAPLQAAER